MAVSIVSPRDLRQHLSPAIDQPIANVDVPFWDTVKANLGYTYDPLMDFISNRLKYDYDDDYSPEFDLAGYEEYSSSLLYARSKNHMVQLKSQIDDNIRRRKILENSSFWAQAGASILDPINIITIPLGGPAITLGRVAARSAIGVGALQTGLEAIRYPFDPLATVDEAALNIGFAAVTGGLIGGAINVPRAMRFKSLNKMIKTADENANEQINLNNINNMLNNNTLTIAQDPKARKKFNNKTQEELKKESNSIGKKIDDINVRLGQEDPQTMPVDRLGKSKLEKTKLKQKEKLKQIDEELAVRHLEIKNTKSTDKFSIAAGGAIGNFISTPLKRVLNSDNIDFAKETLLELISDSGILLNLHKLQKTIGPSIQQKAVIRNGEWVSVYQDVLKDWGDQIDIDVKTTLGVNAADMAVRLENKISRGKGRQNFTDFLIEINRKRIFGEEGSTPAEKSAMVKIDKFFQKWEKRLRATGQIGDDITIRKLIDDAEKDLISLKNKLADEIKRKGKESNLAKLYRSRIERKQTEISENTLSLQTKDDLAPAGEKSFLPRYWDKKYIERYREKFETVLTKWYKENPFVMSKGVDNKWVKTNLSDSKDAIKDRVKKTIDNILQKNDEEIIPNVGAGKSKHFKHRELDIPNQLVWEFIVKDPIAIMKGYTHKVAAKYEYAKQYSGKSVDDVMDDVIEEMYLAGKTEAQINAYRKEYFASYEQVVTSVLTRSPDAWDNKLAFYLKEAAQVNYLGSAGISAIPDFAKIIMEHDMGDIIKGLQALITDNKVNLKGQEAKLVGEAIELIQGNSHFRYVEDITNDINVSSKWDQAKNVFYLANGLAPITHLAKTLDSVIRGHSLIDMSRKVSNPKKYGKPTKLEKSYLARYNIDERIAAKIAATPHEVTSNGLILPNTLKWEASAKVDDETLEVFRTALQSGILNTVIMGTPADKPIIVSGVAYIPMSVGRQFGMKEHHTVKGYARIESNLLGLPFQFYSYSLGALSKITMSAAQGQMKNRMLGLSMSLGLGMMAVQYKTPDFAFEDMTWRDWFARGFDQSGIAALYSDLFYQSMHTALAVTGKNPTGNFIQPKFPSDDAYGAAVGLGGAGPSIAYDYGEALKDMIAGDFSEGAKNMVRSLPFMRMWFWKDEMNAFTNNFGKWF